MRKLPIDMWGLEVAIQTGPPELIGTIETFLDLQTGAIIEIWESDEEFTETTNEPAEVNATWREAIEEHPDRFAEIPLFGLDENREMLESFLHSDWTRDEEKKQKARDAYRGSVGRWKRAIDHDSTVLNAWHAYEQRYVHEWAVKFLAEYGIEPIDRRQQDDAD